MAPLPFLVQCDDTVYCLAGDLVLPVSAPVSGLHGRVRRFVSWVGRSCYVGLAAAPGCGKV